MGFRDRQYTRFAILPPSRQDPPEVFRSIALSDSRYGELLAKMQRLRGSAYRADGAIPRGELTSDGRHKLNIDSRSWHVLSLDAGGDVIACMRFLDESSASGFDSLCVRGAAVARCPQDGPRFRRAVENEMAYAGSSAIAFGEVGGWAVREDHRCTPESLRIVLATYAFLELLGGCAGVATATFRHHSESILRRIGLARLHADGCEIAPYHDPQYGCQMQVLRFDSRYPNPRYREKIDRLMLHLTCAPVVCREARNRVFAPVWRGIEAPSFGSLAVSPGV